MDPRISKGVLNLHSGREVPFVMDFFSGLCRTLSADDFSNAAVQSFAENFNFWEQKSLSLLLLIALHHLSAHFSSVFVGCPLVVSLKILDNTSFSFQTLEDSTEKIWRGTSASNFYPPLLIVLIQTLLWCGYIYVVQLHIGHIL